MQTALVKESVKGAPVALSSPSDSAAVAPPPLAIRLFGAFELSVRGGTPVHACPRRAHWLLALLVLRREVPVSRARLAEELWPDAATPERGLFYLRRALLSLREVLGVERWRIQSPSPTTLRLDLTDCFCDVTEFDAHAAREHMSSLQKAASLYRGELLESCEEAWIVPERSRRAVRFVDVLERLADSRVRGGNLREAARLLHQAIEMDPLREANHCRLMEVLGQTGDHAGVQRQFQALRRTLREGLNIAPSPDALDTYRRARSGAAAAAPQQRWYLSIPADEIPQVSTHRLPCPLTALIGRAQEARDLAEAVDVHRLVTLTGPGGVGKTRLAIAVAEERTQVYVEGIVFVDLAAIRSADDLVADTVAQALGLRVEPPQQASEAICEALALKRTLLLLDNCEHIVEGCVTLLRTVLRRCPFAHVLCTSRQALEIPSEHVVPVSPLSVPPSDMAGSANEENTAQDLMRYEAVALLVERASTRNAPFRVSARNAPAVARICRRLDGLPLALELAAARLRHETPGEIAAQLDDRFRLLRSRSSPALPRHHRTLEAVIAWSYEGLADGRQRRLLNRLSVFRGQFGLSAAESVCSSNNSSTGDADGLLREDIAALLSSLVSRSLIVSDGTGDTARYHLLETVRAFARDRLVESGEPDALRDRHRDHFLYLAEEAAAALSGPERVPWFERLEAMHDNLRAALKWCSGDQNGIQAGLRLIAALWPFWEARGHIGEGRRLAEAVLAGQGAEQPTGARAGALCGVSALAAAQSDFGAGEAWAREALAIYQKLGDKAGQAAVLMDRGLRLSRFQGNPEAGRADFEQSLALRRELGDLRGIAECLSELGRLAQEQGDVAGAHQLMTEALDLSRSIGDKHQSAVAVGNLGNLAAERGDWAAARPLLEEAVSLHGELADKRRQAEYLQLLASHALTHGDLERARAAYDEGMTLLQKVNVDDKFRLSHMTILEGHLLLEEGDLAKARARFEEGLALRRQTSHRLMIDWALLELGHAAWCQRDWDTARVRTAEAGALFREYSHSDGLLAVLESLAGLSAAQGKDAANPAAIFRAARLFGAAQALRQSLGVSGPDFWRRSQARILEAAREVLQGETYAGAREEGHAMGLEEAVRYALETEAEATV